MRTVRAIHRSVAAAVTGALIVAGGISVASGDAGATGSQVVIDTFNPFSGPDNQFGFYEFAGCPPAAYWINKAGGILGHNLKCGTVDTRGDPADAVLAAQQMLASTTNLVGVLGPSSDEDTATVPIINSAKVTMFDNGGTIALADSNYQYFWRTLPADNVSGYALALWAHMKGYKRAAAIFANDVSAQGNEPGVVKGFAALGGQLVANLSVTPDQSSYETELQRVISAHPQVIFTESDPQTAGVLFSELKQAGDLVPIIGTAGDVGPDFNKAFIAAIGKKDFQKYFSIVYPYAPTAGPAWTAYDQGLLHAKGEYKDPAQFANNAYTMAPYDDVITMALAMTAAHSTKPSVYNNFIINVTKPRQGAVVVHTYAEGVAALKSGKQIQYVGASGAFPFNAHHSSPGIYADVLPSHGNQLVATIPTQTLSQLVEH
jgi:ABC-type branched-subunit amino acid transport system substrate-binding protein